MKAVLTSVLGKDVVSTQHASVQKAGQVLTAAQVTVDNACKADVSLDSASAT